MSETRQWRGLSRDGGAAPTRTAIVSMASPWTNFEQFSPIYRHRSQIAAELGLRIRTTWVDHAAATLPGWIRDADLVLVQINHFLPLRLGLELLDRLRTTCARARILYYDGDDDAGVAWPEAVAACDAYVKNQLYRDRSWYTGSFTGKSNLTDYVARHHGVSFADDPYVRSRPLRPADLQKLKLGWNLGCSKIVRTFADRMPPVRDKSLDVVLRATVPAATDWLHPLRQPAVDALRSLAQRYRVVLPDRRVDHATYCREMYASRICVSPFGYGEVCFRDFEAVLAGSLLVKPDMSHLETSPDIYVPLQTYAPVRWDHADLAEVVERLLADEERRRTIAERARQVYDAQTCGAAIVASLRSQMELVGLSPHRDA